MTNKKGVLQISFGWLFALLVGGFILGLAIYAAVTLLGSGEAEVDAKTSKEIGVLLNPLETSFQSSMTTSLIMPVTSRIFNTCESDGTFGRQLIKVQQKSSNKWSETDINVAFLNKYLFSDEFEEGRKFYLFSKPFEFPFKVSDLIYITSSEKNYCFSSAPREITNELEDLNQGNIKTEDCTENSDFVQVCFSEGSNCDVRVSYGGGYVEKERERLYFEGDALMYAAIFATPRIYECQVKRLMKRVGLLSSIYSGKADLVSRVGCNTNMDIELSTLSTTSRSLDDSRDLFFLTETVKSLKQKNGGFCPLW